MLVDKSLIIISLPYGTICLRTPIEELAIGVQSFFKIFYSLTNILLAICLSLEAFSDRISGDTFQTMNFHYRN